VGEKLKGPNMRRTEALRLPYQRDSALARGDIHEGRAATESHHGQWWG